jgi:hypothetical protein
MNCALAKFFEDENFNKNLSPHFIQSILKESQNRPEFILSFAFKIGCLASSNGGLGWHYKNHKEQPNYSNASLRKLAGRLFFIFIKTSPLDSKLWDKIEKIEENANELLNTSECSGNILENLKSDQKISDVMSYYFSLD